MPRECKKLTKLTTYFSGFYLDCHIRFLEHKKHIVLSCMMGSIQISEISEKIIYLVTDKQNIIFRISHLLCIKTESLPIDFFFLILPLTFTTEWKFADNKENTLVRAASCSLAVPGFDKSSYQSTSHQEQDNTTEITCEIPAYFIFIIPSFMTG